jgi:hypothetical protein
MQEVRFLEPFGEEETVLGVMYTESFKGNIK